jgi:hypothetical protein
MGANDIASKGLKTGILAELCQKSERQRGKLWLGCSVFGESRRKID